jgi:uncharacterized membrane protein
MPSIAIPVIALLLYVFVPGLREQPWTALRVGGAVLAFIAYGLVTTARIQLGDSFKDCGVLNRETRISHDSN